MNAKVLCAVGAAAGIAGMANAQVTSSASARAPGNAYVAPAGATVYDNAYDGTSTFGNAAQDFEAANDAFDIWLGDDMSTGAIYTNLELSSVGFIGNGGVDPFAVTDFNAQILDGLPNDPGSTILLESDGFSFNGIDTWTAEFGDQCLPAGDYIFQFRAVNNFAQNGQTYFFQQTIGDGTDSGFQFNPGGGFMFPDDLAFIFEQDMVTPTSPNTVITGEEIQECDGGGDCFADCDDSGTLNILDFVCFQGLFASGDPGADCDDSGTLNILDFVCFQGEFEAGC